MKLLNDIENKNTKLYMAAIRRLGNTHLWSYPRSDDGYFSPDEKFPEYPFNHISSKPNPVYSAVRQVFFDMGLDITNFGKPIWNPLREWIKPGKKVFCLVNFVTHRLRLPFETYENFIARTTHVSVIRAVLDYVILATGDPKFVAYGNAPLQATDYNLLGYETGADKLKDFYLSQTGVNIGPYDLRLFISKMTSYGALLDYTVLKEDDFVQFDLADKSFLEDLPYGSHNLFRVGDYDSRITLSYHGPKRHIYVLHKKVIEADSIISIPVLKTHEKVGITCAIKGCVGAIARKECLAHHRRGGPENGGDEFDRSTFMRVNWSNWNEHICMRGTSLSDNIFRVPLKVLRKCLRVGRKGIMEGAWSGNDTCWRMALDINRCILYGRLDGSWNDEPIRSHSAIIDGIICGEGEGPIFSKARSMGLIIASKDARLADYTCAICMGFDPMGFPIIKNSVNPSYFPGDIVGFEKTNLFWNGDLIDKYEISKNTAPHFKPPKGWRHTIRYL